MCDFNLTLGNKDRSRYNKSFCEIYLELKSLLTESDLENFWRRQNQNSHLYTRYHGNSDTYSGIDRTYTSINFTNLRQRIKTDPKINSFSDHFKTIVIKREPTNFKRGEGFWILNCGLLQGKEYI